MDVFTATVRVHLLAASLPRPLFLQVYALYHSLSSSSEEPADYSVLVELIEADASSGVVRVMQDDFSQLSQRVGVILDAIVEPAIASVSGRQLVDCADILALGGQPPAAEGDAKASALLARTHAERTAAELHRYGGYLEWAAFGLLVCPSELRRHPSLVEVLRVILSESLLLGVHGGVDVYLHQQFQFL